MKSGLRYRRNVNKYIFFIGIKCVSIPNRAIISLSVCLYSFYYRNSLGVRPGGSLYDKFLIIVNDGQYYLKYF